MSDVNISVILNAHREGLIAVATIKSIERAVETAEKFGIHVEVICVLDRGDNLTRCVLSDSLQRNAKWQLLEVEYGDLGRSRNAGVALCRGEWVGFIDADDLWGSEWLAVAYSAATYDGREIVWHPELCLYFGARSHLFLHIDMEDAAFHPAALAFTNLWTALCFVRKSTLLKCPYRQSDIANQIGYEDWDWHIRTVENGVLHKVVKNTCHAIRVKPFSLVQQTNALGCLPRGGPLFRNIVQNRVRSYEKYDFLIKAGAI